MSDVPTNPFDLIRHLMDAHGYDDIEDCDADELRDLHREGHGNGWFEGPPHTHATEI